MLDRNLLNRLYKIIDESCKLSMTQDMFNKITREITALCEEDRRPGWKKEYLYVANRFIMCYIPRLNEEQKQAKEGEEAAEFVSLLLDYSNVSWNLILNFTVALPLDKNKAPYGGPILLTSMLLGSLPIVKMLILRKLARYTFQNPLFDTNRFKQMNQILPPLWDTFLELINIDRKIMGFEKSLEEEPEDHSHGLFFEIYNNNKDFLIGYIENMIKIFSRKYPQGIDERSVFDNERQSFQLFVTFFRRVGCTDINCEINEFEKSLEENPRNHSRIQSIFFKIYIRNKDFLVNYLEKMIETFNRKHLQMSNQQEIDVESALDNDIQSFQLCVNFFIDTTKKRYFNPEKQKEILRPFAECLIQHLQVLRKHSKRAEKMCECLEQYSSRFKRAAISFFLRKDFFLKRVESQEKSPTLPANRRRCYSC